MWVFYVSTDINESITWEILIFGGLWVYRTFWKRLGRNCTSDIALWKKHNLQGFSGVRNSKVSARKMWQARLVLTISVLWYATSYGEKQKKKRQVHYKDFQESAWNQSGVFHRGVLHPVMQCIAKYLRQISHLYWYFPGFVSVCVKLCLVYLFFTSHYDINYYWLVWLCTLH